MRREAKVIVYEHMLSNPDIGDKIKALLQSKQGRIVNMHRECRWPWYRKHSEEPVTIKHVNRQH